MKVKVSAYSTVPVEFLDYSFNCEPSICTMRLHSYKSAYIHKRNFPDKTPQVLNLVKPWQARESYNLINYSS
jgi:hypothetical protein